MVAAVSPAPSAAPAPLSLTGRRWRLPAPTPAAAGAGGLPAWAMTLLRRRGHADAGAQATYLAPSLADLPDPGTMADMPAAVERLLTARSAGQSVVVYGDYDVDGVCAAALMVAFLQTLGMRASFYIPDRRAEGYGLNAAAIGQLAATHDLIVTVDCGITAVAEVALAQAAGTDVIVVDHHQLAAQLPPARACLDPHRPDCAFPFKGLCAAGVAFMLAAAVRRALREAGAFGVTPEPDLRQLLDLVAVATVADMVPMQASNRALVAAGLRVLAQGQRPGLAALCRVAGVALGAAGGIDVEDVAFKLGPRINARGRMESAAAAVELMLTRDAARAATLATLLDAANLARRQVERETVAAAMAQAQAAGDRGAAALVVADPDWHPGVLGLVASRLAARFHRPALVIGAGGKGSGRSVPAVDLHAALTAVAGHLERFGGHPAAAGVTLAPGTGLEPLREALCAEVARQRGGPPVAAELAPDVEIGAPAVDLAMAATLARLGPFGQGNPAPVFVARGLAVRRHHVVGDAHLKLVLDGGADAIGFGLGALAPTLPPRLDAAFTVARQTFRGREQVQMRLVDLRAAAD